jgi:hypothetical protein
MASIFIQCSYINFSKYKISSIDMILKLSIFGLVLILIAVIAWSHYDKEQFENADQQVTGNDLVDFAIFLDKSLTTLRSRTPDAATTNRIAEINTITPGIRSALRPSSGPLNPNALTNYYRNALDYLLAAATDVTLPLRPLNQPSSPLSLPSLINACAGVVDTTPKNDIPIPCAQKVFLELGCTSAGRAFPRALARARFETFKEMKDGLNAMMADRTDPRFIEACAPAPAAPVAAPVAAPAAAQVAAPVGAPIAIPSRPIVWPTAQVAPPVAQVAPPVAQVAPPVAQVAPPVAQVAAPVAQVAPPVVQVAPPVAQVAPPVAQVAAPFPQVAAPVAQVAAPVPQVAAPVPQVAAPVAQVAAPVAQVAAPVAQVAAPVAQVAAPSRSSEQIVWPTAPVAAPSRSSRQVAPIAAPSRSSRQVARVAAPVAAPVAAVPSKPTPSTPAPPIDAPPLRAAPRVSLSDTGYSAMMLKQKSDMLSDIQNIVHTELLASRRIRPVLPDSIGSLRSNSLEQGHDFNRIKNPIKGCPKDAESSDSCDQIEDSMPAPYQSTLPEQSYNMRNDSTPWGCSFD